MKEYIKVAFDVLLDSFITYCAVFVFISAFKSEILSDKIFGFVISISYFIVKIVEKVQERKLSM